MGRPVRVQLNTGLEYRGILACLDGYLNLALEQSEEFRDGQLQAKYGDCFIRGNNGECRMVYYCCRCKWLLETIRMCISNIAWFMCICSAICCSIAKEITENLHRLGIKCIQLGHGEEGSSAQIGVGNANLHKGIFDSNVVQIDEEGNHVIPVQGTHIYRL